MRIDIALVAGSRPLDPSAQRQRLVRILSLFDGFFLLPPHPDGLLVDLRVKQLMFDF